MPERSSFHPRPRSFDRWRKLCVYAYTRYYRTHNKKFARVGNIAYDHMEARRYLGD